MHKIIVKRNFTLIEVLVIVAILGILLTLLLPSLEKARRTSFSVVCKSNLREYGIGSHLYMQKHDGGIFESFATYYTSKGIAGPDALDVSHKDWREGNILSCPERYKDKWEWTWAKMSYGINTKDLYRLSTVRSMTARRHIRYPKLSKIPSLESFILYSDSSHPYGNRRSNMRAAIGIQGRHLKQRANYVCADGHVSSNQSELMASKESPETLWLLDHDGNRFQMTGTWVYRDIVE